jgi:hypothetical protein
VDVGGGDNAPWTAAQRRVLRRLRTPADVQGFLDATPYSTDPVYRCPASVLRDRRAHCFDGAVLAAAAMRRSGHPPLLVDLRAHRDDDHVLALYRVDGHWGVVSKSNVPLLRFREPVFRTVRELVMSYFEFYVNVEGLKALRSHSRPVSLVPFDRWSWTHDDRVMTRIARRLDAAPHLPLLTRRMVTRLRPVDRRTYDACMLGANPEGLYVPS